MAGKDYIKKEIINPNRVCACGCGKSFIARRQDQKFWNHECGERDWRKKHPRKKHLKPAKWKAQPARDPRRDKPESWKAYMEQNPVYFEHVTGKQFSSQALNEAARGIG